MSFEPTKVLGQIDERNARALKFGAVAVGAIVLFYTVSVWAEHWGKVREELAQKRGQLAVFESENKLRGLVNLVPVLEVPAAEQEQKVKFRNRVNEQLKAAGINAEPLQILSGSGRGAPAGYELLRVRVEGGCKFEQMLGFLAGLKENEHLAGVEEFSFDCDEKNREQVTFDMVLSTFVRTGK